MATPDQYTEQTLAEERYHATLQAALIGGDAAELDEWVSSNLDVPFVAFDIEDTVEPVVTRPEEWTYALGQRSMAIVIQRVENKPLIIGPSDVGRLSLIKMIDRSPFRTDTVQW